jgi:hypothetical protein
MHKASSILPKTPPAVVRPASAAQQLQLFFDEIHEKKQKIRELKAIVKEQLEKDEAYMAARDQFRTASEKVKSAKATASRDIGGELDQIQALTSEIEATQETAGAVALGQLQKGEDVELTTKSGRKVRAELRVRFVEEKDAGEDDDE